MSLRFDIQRRKKHNYTKELEEVVDDIKNERFLNKEDVDAPIYISKEQLEARRRADRGIENYEGVPGGPLGEKLIFPLFLVFLASIAASGIMQKGFPLMYGISALLLVFALADKNKDLDGVTHKVSLRSKILFALAAAAMLALAIWLTVKGK